jgi:hypothetical protein
MHHCNKHSTNVLVPVYISLGSKYLAEYKTNQSLSRHGQEQTLPSFPLLILVENHPCSIFFQRDRERILKDILIRHLEVVLLIEVHVCFQCIEIYGTSNIGEKKSIMEARIGGMKDHYHAHVGHEVCK